MIRTAIPVALALLLIAAPAAADYLWAVTETNLVVIDHEDPSEVTVVGPHGLVDPPSYLAYHVAEGRLFGLRSVAAGMIVIALLLPAVAVATVLFFRQSRSAGALMLPYLAWTSFATVLNAALFVMNR